ncbi:MAG: prolipoprotein diacylglyceryl transferase [Oliverpabstia sp.]
MKNELFSIGPFTVYGYGLMIAIGILAAYVTAEYRAKKHGLDPDKIFYLVIWAVVGGFAGAKVLYFLTRLKDIMENPRVLLDLADGFVVYGGIIGGIFSAMVYCKIKKLSFLKYFDLVMPSVALAQGFGRIGCFLAGCCYGRETDSALGIVFHNSNYAPNGVKLLPTQLISSGLDFMLCIVLILLDRKKKGDGQIAGFYLVLYSIGRFILEFYRGDLIRGNVGALTTSQFIAVFVALAGVILIAATNGKSEG